VADITRGKWWTRVGLANVNTTRTGSGARQPALVYRVDYSKGEFDGFGFSGLHGRIDNFNTDGKTSMANLFEVDGYYVRGDWSLFGQASYGQQKGAAIFNSDGVLRDASWWGLSGLAAYKFSPRLEGIVRTDYVHNEKNGGGLLGYTVDDPINGIGRGLLDDGSFSKGESTGANRYAITFGMNYLWDENTIFKVEYRYDGSDQEVFEYVSNGNFRKYNQLFGASVVVSF
jgi:Putative beta-barrel porin-2, OmpL-like. bbp2